MPIQFDLACSEQNICSMWTDTIFEEYICCLEKDPDTIDTLAKCEIFFKDCCDPDTGMSLSIAEIAANSQMPRDAVARLMEQLSNVGKVRSTHVCCFSACVRLS